MVKNALRTTLVLAASWLVPTLAFAVAGPQQDAPFFSWLAVPVIAVAGRKMLKKKQG